MDELSEKTTTNTRDLDGFMKTARDRFSLAEEQERKIREEARIDLQYVAGEQWDPKVKLDRDQSKRPALVFNKLPTFVQSVANECRQNKPQPKVNPMSGGATADVAKVMNGIIRHVQYISRADVAYDTALEYATAGSFGFFRFLTDYCDDESFDQDIKVVTVPDPFAVYGVMMPACMGKPCPWAFVISTMSKDEFKAKYPKSQVTSLNFEGDFCKQGGDWIEAENIRVAEYWYIETKARTLQFLSTGETVYADQYGELPPGITVERERVVDVAVVKQAVINGVEILEETDWLGTSIPIVPVLGRQIIIDGEVRLFSLVRFLRDPQQLLNFYKTGIAEKIGLGNRVPYIGYEGQFTDPKWKDAHVRNYPYLEAKGVTIDGKIAGLPQRQQFEEQIQALSVAAAQETDDMKAIAGIFDASLGAQGNETSGLAIRRRQQQSNITNLHFSDNLERAEWDGCLKLIELIPKIYDKPGRQVRIVGDDEAHSVVTINQQYRDENGKPKHYPLDVGRYDVVVSTGPSYTTARQEGADTLGEVFKVAPEVFNVLGDLWLGSLDYTWSEEAARRLKKAMPPALQEDDADGPQQIPPQVKQQMEVLGQQHDQLVQIVHQLQNEIDTKKIELDSRERIAAMQEETKRTLGLAALDSREGIARLENEIDVLHKRYDREHEAQMAGAQQGHAAEMQDAQQGHEADQAAQQRDAAAAAQQGDQQHQAAMADQAAAQMPKAA